MTIFLIFPRKRVAKDAAGNALALTLMGFAKKRGAGENCGKGAVARQWKGDVFR